MAITYILKIQAEASREVAEALKPALNPNALEVAVTAVNQIHAEGREQGRKEGVLEGERRVLLRQLRRKFGTLPADSEQRIAEAKQSELELWAERVLEATSLEGVFGGA